MEVQLASLAHPNSTDNAEDLQATRKTPFTVQQTLSFISNLLKPSGNFTYRQV
jgi:hypothetical protein